MPSRPRPDEMQMRFSVDEPFWFNVPVDAPKQIKTVLSARSYLIMESLKGPLEDWLAGFRPSVTAVVLHVIYVKDEVTYHSSIEEKRDEHGATSLYLTILPCNRNSITTAAEETTLRLVGIVEAALRQLAQALFASSLPPSVSLTKRERIWLQSNSRPDVCIESMAPRLLVDAALIDVWEILEKFTTVAEFEHRFTALTDNQKLGIRMQIERRLAVWRKSVALSSEPLMAASDSEEYHGVSLLLGGKQLWESALEAPDNFMNVWPVSPEDAQEVMMLTLY